MVVRQRPIESITTEGASPSSTTRFTAVVRRCSSVLWSSNRPSIFIGLNISNTYASVDYPSDAAVQCDLACLRSLDYQHLSSLKTFLYLTGFSCLCLACWLFSTMPVLSPELGFG